MPRVDKGKNWYSGKKTPAFLHFIAGHTHTIILHNKRTCKKTHYKLDFLDFYCNVIFETVCWILSCGWSEGSGTGLYL